MCVILLFLFFLTFLIIFYHCFIAYLQSSKFKLDFFGQCSNACFSLQLCKGENGRGYQARYRSRLFLLSTQHLWFTGKWAGPLREVGREPNDWNSASLVCFVTWFPLKIKLVCGHQAWLPEKAIGYFAGVTSTFQDGRDEQSGLIPMS